MFPSLTLARWTGAAGLALALAASAAAEPAELVLRGGAVFTADADNPAATAVAVRDGRIVYVGDDGGHRTVRAN